MSLNYSIFQQFQYSVYVFYFQFEYFDQRLGNCRRIVLCFDISCLDMLGACNPEEDIVDLNLINSTPSPPLNQDQGRRRFALMHNRTLTSSRWIDVATINELGLGNFVEFLTSRIGLWNFLTDAVRTYKGITLQFSPPSSLAGSLTSLSSLLAASTTSAPPMRPCNFSISYMRVHHQ